MRITPALACMCSVPPNWISMRQPSKSYWTAALMPSSPTPTTSYIVTKGYMLLKHYISIICNINVFILGVNSRILYLLQYFMGVTVHLKQSNQCLYLTPYIVQALWWQKLFPELCERTRLSSGDNGVLLTALKGSHLLFIL